MERRTGEDIITSFEIAVAPPAGFTANEVFAVEVQHASDLSHGVVLRTVTRQSIYKTFHACADKGVDIKLCACATTKRNSSTRIREGIVDLTRQRMFGSGVPSVKEKDSGCLLVVTRSSGAFSVAHEVANVCGDRTYRVTVSGATHRVVLSRSLPFDVIAPPLTIHFAFSAIKHTTNDGFYDIDFKAKVISWHPGKFPQDASQSTPCDTCGDRKLQLI